MYVSKFSESNQLVFLMCLLRYMHAKLSIVIVWVFGFQW